MTETLLPSVSEPDKPKQVTFRDTGVCVSARSHDRSPARFLSSFHRSPLGQPQGVAEMTTLRIPLFWFRRQKKDDAPHFALAMQAFKSVREHEASGELEPH
jgi:hypothetical protein